MFSAKKVGETARYRLMIFLAPTGALLMSMGLPYDSDQRAASHAAPSPRDVRAGVSDQFRWPKPLGRSPVTR